MNIVSKKSTLMSLVLAGLVVGNTAKGLEWQDIKDLSGRQWAIAFVLGSAFVTNCKEAVPNPEKVTWDDVKKLVQFEGFQEYLDNVVHLINNGWLGQAGIRGKAMLGMTNEEDGSMMFKEIKALPSTGICGKTLATVKLWGKKAKDISAVLSASGLIAAMWADAQKAGNVPVVPAPQEGQAAAQGQPVN